MIRTTQILEAPDKSWALLDSDGRPIDVGDKLTILDAWFGYDGRGLDRDHLDDGDIRWRWTTMDGRKMSVTCTLAEAWARLERDEHFEVMEASS